ncbi:MAG TPA: hypothetical protein VNU97_06520 [Rhizomicrobium sp.]|jgi:hypothetical protein|nr:hypothetical protein [Rhizomicrobium sp.]
MNHQSNRRPRHKAIRQCTNIAIGSLCAFALLHASNAPAASLSRSVDVAAPAAAKFAPAHPTY